MNSTDGSRIKVEASSRARRGKLPPVEGFSAWPGPLVRMLIDYPPWREARSTTPASFGARPAAILLSVVNERCSAAAPAGSIR